MIYKTRGIVFRTIKYSETSVVCKIYTEKFGMQSYIVNGVRSQKSKMRAALLQVMTLLDMEVYHHEHRNLNRIKEMRADYMFSSLLFEPLKSSLGLFMIEVLSKVIREEEANETLFNFISEKLKALDTSQKIAPDYLLRFLLELSSLIGFYPHGIYNSSSSCFDLQAGRFVDEISVHPYIIHPPLSEYFSNLLTEGNFPAAHESGKIRRELLDVLLKYYQMHVPNFTVPKSLHVLKEVFQG